MRLCVNNHCPKCNKICYNSKCEEHGEFDIEIGYMNFMNLIDAHDIIIRVDGICYDHCIEADEEKGFIIYIAKDKYGNEFFDPESEELKIEKITGYVEIMLFDKKEKK